MRYVVVAAPPDVMAPDDIARLPRAADVIELRLDLLPGALTPQGAQRWRVRPVLGSGDDGGRGDELLTVRSRAHGGRAESPQAASDLLASLAGYGWAVDVEVEAVAAWDPGTLAALARPGTLVVSRHGSFAPIALPWRERTLLPVVLKRAARVEDAADLALFRAALREATDAITGRAVMPTGPLAALRVLDPHAALLYGSAGHAVVEGQPSLLSLLDELRAGEVTPRARLFGLLGNPPAASPTPMLHNAVFRSLGQDAVHVPLPGLALETALSLPFQGYSVTTPFKEQALALADDADPGAEVAGAANTLVRRPEGGWKALNTDVDALVTLLPQAAVGARLVVYGAGGFARAVLVAARLRGYEGRVVARHEERGRALAQWAGATWSGSRFEREARDAVLVNATPAGARGEVVKALEGKLAGLTVVDAPYGEPGTATWLVRAARGGGAARVVDGLELLLAQAAGQSHAFTQRAVDPSVLRLGLRPRTSLVLAGLRGAGKTTVGRLVARRLGRPFVDLDEEVQRVGGRSPAEILEADGPAALRAQEGWAVERLAGRHGLVVATGGGVVEDPRNIERLRALGLCVWLEVPAAVAAARVRGDPTPRPPLIDGASPENEAEALLSRRSPRYALLAHERSDANRPPEAVSAESAERWLRFEEAARRSEEG